MTRNGYPANSDTPKTVELWEYNEGTEGGHTWTTQDLAGSVVDAWMGAAEKDGYQTEIYEMHHGPECFSSPEPCECSQYATDHRPIATHNPKGTEAEG